MSNKPDSADPSHAEMIVATILVALLIMVAGVTCSDRPQIVYGRVAPLLAAIDKTTSLLKAEGQEISTRDLRRSLSELRSVMSATEAASTNAEMHERSRKLLNEALEQIDAVERELSRRSLKSSLTVAELETRLGDLRAELQAVSTPVPILGKEFWGALPVLLWPVLIASFLGYLFWSEQAPQRLARIFGQFKSVKLPGFEFLMQGEARDSIHRAFADYREQAKKEFDKKAEALGMASQLKKVVDGVCDQLDLPQALRAELRATIHVEDFLFENTLYQLLDYYPKGGGSGRAFTARFGIIGKAWRSDESQIQEQVPTDPKQLVMDWGMTWGEARGKGIGKQSFACVVLWDKPNGRKVGLLYMDAEQQNAFGGRTSDMKDLIEKKCVEEGLIGSLIKLREQVYRSAPMLKVHE
jgi:hypothetical protein